MLHEEVLAEESQTTRQQPLQCREGAVTTSEVPAATVFPTNRKARAVFRIAPCFSHEAPPELFLMVGFFAGHDNTSIALLSTFFAINRKLMICRNRSADFQPAFRVAYTLR